MAYLVDFCEHYGYIEHCDENYYIAVKKLCNYVKRWLVQSGAMAGKKHYGKFQANWAEASNDPKLLHWYIDNRGFNTDCQASAKIKYCKLMSILIDLPENHYFFSSFGFPEYGDLFKLLTDVNRYRSYHRGMVAEEKRKEEEKQRQQEVAYEMKPFMVEWGRNLSKKMAALRLERKQWEEQCAKTYNYDMLEAGYRFPPEDS